MSSFLSKILFPNRHRHLLRNFQRTEYFPSSFKQIDIEHNLKKALRLSCSNLESQIILNSLSNKCLNRLVITEQWFMHAQ